MDTATLVTAIAAAATAAIGSFAWNWYIEGRKRVLDLRAKAYADFAEGLSMPNTDLERKVSSIISAKARAALFGGGVVVDALGMMPDQPTEADLAMVIAAMRSDLVGHRRDERDERRVFRAVFGRPHPLDRPPERK